MFNETFSLVMLFDFVQSSLHIATILTQILGVNLLVVFTSNLHYFYFQSNVTLLSFLFVGTHFLSMLLRLFLYYYYANETLVLVRKPLH